MEEWKEYKLGDISDITKLAGFEFTKYVKYKPDGEIIAIRALNLRDGHLDLKDIQKIEKETSNGLLRSKLYKGDIVLSYTGTIGACAIITENDRFHLAPNVCKITPCDSVEPFFLYYIIRSRAFQDSLIGYAHGSTQPTIPMKTIREIPIRLCSKEKQFQIACILKSLDDKIEVNRKINENLEQQAQALFKSWFVDFEPFKNGEFVDSELGMIPKGWRVESLSSIADYINGLAMQKYRPIEGEDGLPVLKIKELGQGNCDINSELCSPSLIGDKYIINDGDIIFSWSGTLMVKVWCGGKCGLNQHLFVVVPKGYRKWFVYQWTKYHLDNFIRIAKDKAVTMGHIKRGELDKAKVVIPDSDNLTKIYVLMDSILNQIISNELESRRLATLRDTLLPKLMSGELKVNEIEI